jgi:hypothetical protein
MADNAVVAGGLAGNRRMFQIPWISRHTVLVATCEALAPSRTTDKASPAQPVRKRRELS